MNLQEVKNQFPEAVGEIETLERLGFASRSGNWIDTLDFEEAQTACWLVGRVGDEPDADALIRTLSGQRRELWILQQLPSVSSLLRSTLNLCCLFCLFCCQCLRNQGDFAQAATIGAD